MPVPLKMAQFCAKVLTRQIMAQIYTNFDGTSITRPW